jgi:hypothetical protein
VVRELTKATLDTLHSMGVTASAASDAARGSLARSLRRRQYEAEPGAAMERKRVALR